MPLRFHRRIRIAPGLRVNLSKRGASLSIGEKSAWYTMGPRGRRVTVGLPGTGFYWTEQVKVRAGKRIVFVAMALLVLVFVLALALK